MMQIDGRCHCGNVQYALDWPGEASQIKARACSCTFCTKHGGRWTSHRDAALTATIVDAPRVAKYRFGTATAEFHVCTRCGVVPFVTSEIDGRLYAVVNVNTFENVAVASLPSTGTNFDGEGTGDRLERRKRHWIPTVRIHDASPDSVPASPVAIVASQAPARTRPSNYPEPFASRMAGRQKRPLGEPFGLTNFGVNLTTLAPGATSALRHAHTQQDEFVYILEGRPTLHSDEGYTSLSPGMCAGFRAGTGNAHRLINETVHAVVYLEVGDRTPGDAGRYPDDDLEAVMVDGAWKFVHKDGSPY